MVGTFLHDILKFWLTGTHFRRRSVIVECVAVVAYRGDPNCSADLSVIHPSKAKGRFTSRFVRAGRLQTALSRDPQPVLVSIWPHTLSLLAHHL
jgi:hypothetical protein